MVSKVSVAVLGILNGLGALLVVAAYAMMPADRWDQEMLDGAGITALLALPVAVLTALLTVYPARLHWLGRRWLVAPAVVFVLALARYVWLDQVYQPW
jgi:hypothetical protein